MTRLDHDQGIYPTEVPKFDVHEEPFNPEHQGFIGFIPPSEGPMGHIEKTAKRIAAELILMPKTKRGKTKYSEDYLKQTSGCRTWTRLRCAYCDCWKSEEDK